MPTDETKLKLYKEIWSLTRRVIAKNEKFQDYSSPIGHQARVHNVYTDEEGVATVVWKIFLGEELRNTMGFAHGGALTTMVDILTWNSLFADKQYWPEGGEGLTLEDLFKLRKQPTLSRKLNVRFARPVVLDKEYSLSCKVISNSAHGAFISARLHDDQGKTFVFGVQDMAKSAPRKSKL